MTRGIDFSLIRKAAQAADEKKGVDVVAFDVRNLTALADAFIFIGGTSHIHVRTLEDAIREALKDTDAELKRTDGLRGHPWRALDYGNFIIHIMDQSTREFYSLERLWSQGKEISLKFKKPTKKKAVKHKRIKKTKKTK